MGFSKKDIQMASEHVKRYFTSFREIQVKTPMRYNFIFIMKAIKTDNNYKNA